MSSNSDLDHPLCEECTDALLDLMDATLSRTQRQAQLSQQLLTSLSDMPHTDVTALQNELDNVGFPWHWHFPNHIAFISDTVHLAEQYVSQNYFIYDIV